ncbi:MAG: hypothetical protein K6B28_00420 [Lachnospiraceae bacterium]|nr:hypothetical protein [Lachnospiraceae bacterium]
MGKMKKLSGLKKLILGVLIAAGLSITAAPAKVSAQVYVLPDGTVFDSDFYANLYPEMKAGYANGKYPERLLWHYLTYGIREGRLPSLYSTAVPSPAVSSTPYVYPAGFYCVVPVNSLYPYTPYIYNTCLSQ